MSERVASGQASGLTAVEFSEQHGYSSKLLQWWSSRLRPERKAAKEAIERVPLAKVVRAAPATSSKSR